MGKLLTIVSAPVGFVVTAGDNVFCAGLTSFADLTAFLADEYGAAAPATSEDLAARADLISEIERLRGENNSFRADLANADGKLRLAQGRGAELAAQLAARAAAAPAKSGGGAVAAVKGQARPADADSVEPPPSDPAPEAQPPITAVKLSATQERVLDHLQLCAVKTGSEVVTIEMKTLADKTGVPLTSIYYQCEALEKKGLIAIKRNGTGVAPTITVHGALDGLEG